jgi:hypothetical protein
MSYHDEGVYVDGLWLVQQTPMSYGVSTMEGSVVVEAWLPKSEMLRVDLDPDYEGSVIIPRWLAAEKGLAYEEWVEHDGELDW